jgi:hypothetical protein
VGNPNMNNCVFGSVAVGLVSGLLGLPVISADLDWGIETTIGHTDNATRTSSAGISDNVGSVGGYIDLRRDGSRIDGRLRSDGSFRDYFDNTYNDDFLGSVTAELQIGLIGESVIWSADDTFGQALSDSFAPSTPDNRENINVFSTGPDIRLQLGRSTEAVIQGRYQDTNYENSNGVDNERVTVGIAFVRHASPTVAWSLNADTSSVDFDDIWNSGYDQQDIFVRLESRDANQTLTADVGIGFLGGGDQTDQTAIARINWMRHLSPSWALELDAASEFENADDQFVAGVSGGTELGGTQDIELSGQAMRNDRATLTLHFVRPRTRLRFSGDIGQETYPDTTGLDRNRWSVGAEATRRLTERLDASIEVFHENRDFDTGTDERDKTDRYSTRIDWRVGRLLFLGIEARREDRSGNTGYSYEETIYLASLSYRTSAL